MLRCYIINSNDDLEQIPQRKIDEWIKQVDKDWSDDMKSLVKYIQQPILSTDHPKGNKLKCVIGLKFRLKSDVF